jgi:8-oxo-dGTP diphosphatase
MAQDPQLASKTSPNGPAWPRCGASAAIFRDDRVLLVQRGKGALIGLWSLPGGHIEPGETAKAAAIREVREEAGVEAEVLGLVDVHDVILHGTGGELKAHYLIAVFWGRWLAGEPHPGVDERAAEFVPVAEIEAGGRYRLTEGAAALILRARAQLEKGGA